MEALDDAVRALMADPDHARACGQAARRAAVSRFGLQRFLDEWDELLEEVG
jgi:glycosyltransferase involved in cell wall biosynthesis